MAALTPVLCARSGGGDVNAGAVTPTITTGDTFPAGPNSFLAVANTSAGAITVTVNPPTGGGPLGTTVGAFTLSPTVPITTGLRIYGPFPVNPFADANGNITAICSAVASVKVTALLMSTS